MLRTSSGGRRSGRVPSRSPGVASSPGRTTNSDVRPDRWFDLQGRVRVKGKKALVLGVEYRGQRRSVDGALRTARDLVDLLHRVGFAGEIRSLLEDSGHAASRPTLHNILKSIDWLTENVSPDDDLYIFYVGLGGYANKLSKTHALAPLDYIQEGLLSETTISDLLHSVHIPYRVNIICDSGFGGTILEGVSKIWCEDSGVGSSVQRSPGKRRQGPEIVVLSGARDEASFEHAIGQPGQLLPAYIAAVESIVSDNAAGGGAIRGSGTPCDFSYYELLPRIRAELQGRRCSLVPQFSCSASGFDWSGTVFDSTDEALARISNGVQSSPPRRGSSSPSFRRASSQRDQEDLDALRAYISAEPIREPHSSPPHTAPHPLHEAAQMGWGPLLGSPTPPDYIHKEQIKRERMLLEREIEKALNTKNNSSGTKGNMKVVIDAPKNCRIDFQCEPQGAPQVQETKTKRRSRSREAEKRASIPEQPISNEPGKNPGLLSATLPQVVGTSERGERGEGITRRVSMPDTQVSDDMSAWGGQTTGSADVQGVVKSRAALFENQEEYNSTPPHERAGDNSSNTAEQFLRRVGDTPAVRQAASPEDGNHDAVLLSELREMDSTEDDTATVDSEQQQRGRMEGVGVGGGGRNGKSPVRAKSPALGRLKQSEREHYSGGAHDEFAKLTLIEARERERQIAKQNVEKFKKSQEVQARRQADRHRLEFQKERAREQEEYEGRLARHAERVHTYSQKRSDGREHPMVQQVPASPAAYRSQASVISKGEAMRTPGSPQPQPVASPARRSMEKRVSAQRQRINHLQTEATDLLDLHMVQRRAMEMQIEALQEVSSQSQYSDRSATPEAVNSYVQTLPDVLRRDALRILKEYETTRGPSPVRRVHIDPVPTEGTPRTPYHPDTPARAHLQLHEGPGVDRVRELQKQFSPPHPQSVNGRSIRINSGGGAEVEVVERSSQTTAEDRWHIAKGKDFAVYRAYYNRLKHYVPYRKVQRLSNLASPSPEAHPHDGDEAAEEAAAGEWVWNEETQDYDWVEAAAEDAAAGGEWVWNDETQDYDWVEAAAEEAAGGEWVWNEETQDYDWVEAAAEAAAGEWVWNEETQDHDWVEAAGEEAAAAGEWVWNEETQDHDWVEAAAEAAAEGEWVWNEETQDHDWVEAAAAGDAAGGGEWVWNEANQDYDWVE